MRKALWLSSFCLWPAVALAGADTSAYTPFDLEKTCVQVEKGDDTVFAGTWKCKGLKGNDIAISVVDERSYVGLGPQPTGTCAFRRTFGRFNTALSPVEWRLRNGKPFAAIQRWRVVTDDDGNSATWLVITALKGREACHVHYIAGSYPNANEHAREAADVLVPDFDCEHDVATVDSTVGSPGVDVASCWELRGQ